MPDDWQLFYQQAFIAEQYFYSLLWQEKNEQAAEYAELMIRRLALLAAPVSIWLERRGDAAFYMRDYNTARQYYTRSLNERDSNIDSDKLYVKLSDIYFLTGNYDKERLYREKIYGSLIDERCS